MQSNAESDLTMLVDARGDLVTYLYLPAVPIHSHDDKLIQSGLVQCTNHATQISPGTNFYGRHVPHFVEAITTRSCRRHSKLLFIQDKLSMLHATLDS